MKHHVYRCRAAVSDSCTSLTIRIYAQCVKRIITRLPSLKYPNLADCQASAQPVTVVLSSSTINELLNGITSGSSAQSSSLPLVLALPRFRQIHPSSHSPNTLCRRQQSHRRSYNIYSCSSWFLNSVHQSSNIY